MNNQQVNAPNGGVNVRAQTSQLVATVAVSTGEPRYQVWQRIYTRLETAFGVQLHSYPRKIGESLLNVAERNNLMEKVYSLAYAEHLYLQSYEE